MMNSAKRIIVSGLLIALFASLAACSTVKGFGKDVSKTGNEIQKAAS